MHASDMVNVEENDQTIEMHELQVVLKQSINHATDVKVNLRIGQ